VALTACLVAFRRAGYEGATGTVARAALIVVGAVAAWSVLGVSAGSDPGAERRALEGRMTALAARAMAPGSALACLDAAAGDVVDKACESALFATPQATAAAVAYVSAKLALLADASAQARHDAGFSHRVAQLRRSTQADRYGIVAHVLSERDGCTAERCDAFALLDDSSRISANITSRTFEANVKRRAADWPTSSSGPVASSSVSPSPPMAAASAAIPGLPQKPPGPDVFFPSAASIPPVNIMTAEPAAPPPAPKAQQAHQAGQAREQQQETTGSSGHVAKTRAPRTPPRRHARAAPPPPVNLNADVVRDAPSVTVQ
jgi:hypothetical protein